MSRSYRKEKHLDRYYRGFKGYKRNISNHLRIEEEIKDYFGESTTESNRNLRKANEYKGTDPWNDYPCDSHRSKPFKPGVRQLFLERCPAHLHTWRPWKAKARFRLKILGQSDQWCFWGDGPTEIEAKRWCKNNGINVFGSKYCCLETSLGKISY